MSYLMSSQRSFDQNTRMNSSYVQDQHNLSLPKVGQTRCYWAMLSEDLQFIYLDPVLQSHLEEQAQSLVGKSLLSFVHPDEQASAKQDLGGVLDSRTLHGSVTRVRFSRLSTVRRQLGYQGPLPAWSEADKIALDKDYMAVDIVINWAAEGLVLCFIHAIVDLSPGDNDETQKTEWTNWCGTAHMPMTQIEALYRALLMCVPQPGNMSRVFQILSTQRDRPLLMSWPPDSAQGPNSRDFAKLVDNVHIGADVTTGNDAKTSCTRRYKSSQGMPQVFGGEVESIFIPHGTVIFACHKVNSILRGSANSSAPMQQLAYGSANYNAQQNASYYEQGGSYALPPLSPQSQSYHNNFVAQQGPGIQSSYPQRWTQGPLSSSISNLRSGSYPPTSGSPTNQTWQQGPGSSYLDTGSAQAFNRPLSPAYTNYSPTTASSAGASPISDIVPPPRRRISPGSSRDQPGSGRAAGNRPTGVQKCSSCKATSSPEWRKGPSGKKELCNACGLRYARSRAKKEGTSPAQQQRRRKEKGSKRDSPIPPTSTSVYSAIRRNYAESSFSTSSAGSASGSDIYPHSSHHILDNMTPSPSPPASNMNFVHYAPGGSDSRPSYSGPQAGGFYNVPSPLSNPPVLHPHDQQQQQSLNSNQLPPLGQLSSYADRSPVTLSTSPIPHSSLTTTLPAASYERERERERDPREPPTPLSAQPRLPRRSILTQQ